MREMVTKSLNYWKRWATAKQNAEKERGLTLIEMLAVVVILGIVAAIAIPAVTSAITQSKVNSTESTLGTLQSALSRYYLDNGSYPANLSYLESTSPTQPTASGASTLSSITTTPPFTPPLSTWNGPYIQEVFPLTDGWGNDIEYVPLYSTILTTGTSAAPGTPFTGYLLLSGDGQALSVPTTAPSSGTDFDLGTTQYTETGTPLTGSNLIYAAGGTAANIDASTVAAATYIGVGPTKGPLPANIYDIIDGNTIVPSTLVPVND